MRASQKPRTRFLIALPLVLVGVLVLPVWCPADDTGRYRAIVLHEGGRSNQSAALTPKVFILDSRDGHMWTWEQNSRVPQANNKFSFGTVLTYQGKLKVGKTMGDIMAQSRQ